MSINFIMHAFVDSVTVVQNNVTELESDFADIEYSAISMLSEKKITTNDFREIFANLSSEHVEQFERMCSESDPDFSVDDLWQTLSTFWTFHHYSLLEQLVFRFGDANLRARLMEYSQRLEKFLGKTLLHDFAMHSIIIGKFLPDGEFSDIVVQVDPKNFYTSNLRDLENLIESIARKFSLLKFALVLKDLKSSDFTVRFAVPATSLRKVVDNNDFRLLWKGQWITCTVDNTSSTPHFTRSVALPFRSKDLSLHLPGKLLL